MVIYFIEPVAIEDFDPNIKIPTYLFFFCYSNPDRAPYKNSFVDGPTIRWVVMGRFHACDCLVRRTYLASLVYIAHFPRDDMRQNRRVISLFHVWHSQTSMFGRSQLFMS